MTAWTSPLLMASVTPLRISLPSTLARRSRISKSANLLAPCLDFISAVRCRLADPARSLHRRAQQSRVHLLLVLAGQRAAHRDVLARAVAVADRQPAVRQLHALGHVAVLGGEPGELGDARLEIQPRQAGRVLGLPPGGTPG